MKRLVLATIAMLACVPAVAGQQAIASPQGRIRRVATAWDETRFLQGEPGRDIVLARRQGRSWYLGAMTADEARTERVPLRFLPSGRWRATVWRDGATPDEVTRSERIVTPADVLALPLAAAGGAAVILEPVHE